MNLLDVVRETAREVAETGIDEALRPIAFEKLLEAKLRGSGGQAAQATPSSPMVQTGEQDALGKIATKLGLERDAIEDVFHVDGDDVALGVASGKLDAAAARATKEIALLIVAARQAAGVDDGWTKFAVIREVCRDYNRLDGNNFAATVQGMTTAFTFKGRGADREVHLTRPGWDAARTLVAKLAGVEV